MAEQIDPSEVPVVKEVELRLARPDERLRWDELMDLHHPLGFKQFAGRGLRYVAEWRGQWLALLGWQTGAFQCRPREQWLGWHKAVQFRRLHLVDSLFIPAVGRGFFSHCSDGGMRGNQW